MALSGSVTHLLDKSASARAKFSVVGDRLASMFEGGQLATCSIIDLEVLFSARSGSEYETVRLDRAMVYERVAIEQRDFDRAIEFQTELAARNRHRQAPIPDLLIAAVAEKAGLTVLHYDADFDLLAEVSGASTEWVVPKGTL